jgi:hypothetical protein
MKPPRKIPKPSTPDTDTTVRDTSPDDGAPPRRELPVLPGRNPDIPSNDGSPGTGRAEGDPGNLPRQPQVEVADMPTAGQAATTTRGAPSDISFLPSFLVSTLPGPQADGLRYGKRQTVYAEIEHEGVTLVRRGDDGEYRAAWANELNTSGPTLERIAETAFWRRKNTDEQAGPSSRKRPRLETEDDTPSGTDALVSNLLAQNTVPVDLSTALWRNWGSSTKPASGESLEIGGLHYRLVPRGLPERNGIAYVEHPRFSPSRYEAFEQMLHDDPGLQPRWAIKREGQWEMLGDRLPFDKPLKAHVAETFRDFSEVSLNTVAKGVFVRANHADVIDGLGLSVMKQTFRHWVDPIGARAPRYDLADPLLMLPALPRTLNSGWIALPAAELTGGLRRLDFDPQHFPAQWNTFIADPSNHNLKLLVSHVLGRNGYSVFPLTNEHSGPTLVFTRANHDSVFFLKLGQVNGESIRQVTPSGDELSDSLLTLRIGQAAHARLRVAFDQNKVVWLLGGAQTTATGTESVFIIREG